MPGAAARFGERERNGKDEKLWKGRCAMLTALAGLTWGGGAESVMERLLETSDIIVRYQGGGAPHTLRTEDGSYRFRVLPEGLKYPGKVCVLGDGMVIDLDCLRHELSMMRYFHLPAGPENLRISARAVVLMPFSIREGMLARQASGQPPTESSRQGFIYAYADKALRQALRMGDLLHLGLPAVRQRLRRCVDQKNAVFTKVYGDQPLDYKEMVRWCEEQAAFFAPYICDTGRFLTDAAEEGKEILFASQFGALLDLDYGLYPYTSSFNTLAGFAAVRSGMPGHRPDRIVGTLPAYSVGVAGGPFPAQSASAEDWGEMLSLPGDRPPGLQYGPFDLPAARYGMQLQHPDTLVLCGLEALSGLRSVPVVTGYRAGDTVIRDLDALLAGDRLDGVRPESERLPGWEGDISGIRSFSGLPQEAKRYAAFLEEGLGRRFDGVSVGEGPESIIPR